MHPSSQGGQHGQSSQDMQRFQQLQAQLRQQQQQQQQFGANPQFGAMQQTNPGMNMNVMLQHAGLNQSQRNFASGSGVMGMPNVGAAQPQQLQQQQSGGSFSNFAFQGSALDASSGSSARLMAMAGMGNAATFPNMTGLGQNNTSMNASNSSSSALQNMQAILLQQQRQQQHAPKPQLPATMSGLAANFNPSQQQMSMQNNTGVSSSTSSMMGLPGGASSNAQQQLFFQQQLAALQRQQQMSTGVNSASNTSMMGMQTGLQHQAGSTSDQVSGSISGQQTSLPSSQQQNVNSQQNILHARQQALLQQMQQQRNSMHGLSSGTNFNPSMLQQVQEQQLQGSGNENLLHQVSGGGPGLSGMLQQQPQLQGLSSQASGLHQSMMNVDLQQQQQLQIPSQQQLHQQQQGMGGQGFGLDFPGVSMTRHESTGGSDHNSHGTNANTNDVSSSAQMQFSHPSGTTSPAILKPEDAPGGQSFLDGRFAGGWQSNADLAERRRVIFNILEIIRQMRPDTSKLTNKLPQMAKSLEEHLYRSAKSKEEYMDTSTLKKRLQAIAHGLEVHRTSDPLQRSESLGAPAIQQQPPFQSTSTGNISNAPNPSSNWPMNSSMLSNNLVSQDISGHVSQFSSQQPTGHQVGNLPQRGVGNSGLGAGSMQQIQVNQNPTSDFWSNHSAMSSQPLPYQPSQNQDNNQEISMTNQSSFIANQQSTMQHDISSQQSITSNTSIEPVLYGGSQHGSNLPNIPNVGIADPTTSSKFQQPTDAQKKKVILQQQQRLLLLRHASKCKAGSQCSTKFCGQMVTLWKHMKTCRDKNCKTPHCLSSRCVLNHYRICKSNGRTLACEVCGPVMKQIKQQERDYGNTDPLVREQETTLPPGSTATYDAQGNMNGTNQVPDLNAVQHSKLQAQFDSLKLLQKQQEQLLEQQKRLEEQAQLIQDPNSPQARQLHEQQMLLQELQKRCQQQQLLVQQELQMQSMNDVVQPTVQAPASVGVVDMEPKQDVLKSSDSFRMRRGSGIGQKDLGRSLGSQHSYRQSDVEGELTKKKRSTAVNVDRSPKKVKVPANKQKDKDQPKHVQSITKEEDGSSFCFGMTPADIRKHLESLNKRIVLSSRTVTHKCRPLIQELIDHQFGWVFKDAVDPVALGLPDYFDVVQNPMHLDLVRKKLENAIYSDMESFARDTKLVFENAILYNGEDSEVGELAQVMLNHFAKSYNAVVQDIESSHLNLESQGELCSLCGVQKRRFEPTTLYCQGGCGMQRIKRNASYFTDRTKQNHWCSSCFEQIKPEDPIILDDGSEVRKCDLQEFKNDALPEEGWVNCDVCHSWVHQICALFNGRTNKSDVRFTCPNCCLKKMETEQIIQNLKLVKDAEDLPRCKMSDAIEMGVASALETAYSERAEELGISMDEVEKSEKLTIRVLSNVDKKHFVRERMLERYSKNDCPAAFPVRTKCLALFQKIHGVDTMLFAMYVYEYGHECPAPNRRRVYISYLDSVRYFEPKCYRTTVYHSILIEYLRYVKKRGFHTAHIWSCPPTPGDDYIFYCHPKHQLVPREDMLRAWYHKMLDKAKAQGVVIRTTTLYDEYFGKESADPLSLRKDNPTCLPYFEGDYIPGEIENIIQHLEVDKSKDIGPTDRVLDRIGRNLNKMKENFIVVHLRNRRFAAAVERGEDVSRWKEDSDDEMVRSKRAKISVKDAGAIPSPEHVSENLVNGSDEVKIENDAEVQTIAETNDGSSKQESLPAQNSRCSVADDQKDANVAGSLVDKDVEIRAESEQSTEAETAESCKATIAATPIDSGVYQGPAESKDGDQAITVESMLESRELESRKDCVSTLSDGENTLPVEPQSQSLPKNDDVTKEMRQAVALHFSGLKRPSSPVDDTFDEDAPIESEMFESRQQFLNYCQTTHCQFDELRRAKHSTIMVLFQLHNPMAPKFLQQCGACYRDITHGIRYHCQVCVNFDLCQDCYEPVTSGLWAKRDPRFAHDKKHQFTPFDLEATEENQKVRAERQKSLKAHIELLEHAGTCSGPPGCSLQNCQRLKKLFLHVPTCDVRPKKDCKICTRLLALCTMHARNCAERGPCPIPFCDRIRERNKRLRRQQELMDDRRRQAQNELYQNLSSTLNV